MKKMEAPMAELKRTTQTKKSVSRAAEALAAKKPDPAQEARAATAETLAAMGEGELAYVRAFRAAELKHLFPQSADLHPTVELFALFGADGAPLMLADSKDAVVSGAWQHDLNMATLH
jgi:hypothetical protein